MSSCQTSMELHQSIGNIVMGSQSNRKALLPCLTFTASSLPSCPTARWTCSQTASFAFESENVSTH